MTSKNQKRSKEYFIQNIRLEGNETNRLTRDTIYAELVDSSGKIYIASTLNYILASIRDRKLNVEGVSVVIENKKSSTVLLDRFITDEV